MAIDSMSFLFLFLPTAILLFAITPARTRPLLVLLLSGLLYYSLEGSFLVLMAGVLLFDYLMAWLLHHSAGFPRMRRWIVFCSVAKSIVLIVYYGAMHQLSGTHIPLGLGVYALTSMGYVLDCYHNFATFDRNPVPVLLMNSFLPSLYAGPVTQYARTGIQLRSLRFTWAQIGEGGGLFLCGMAKKLLLGDPIRQMLETLREIPTYQVSGLTVWVMVATLSLTLYFTLSGWCDMARGLGLMFGFELPQNFFYPCRAKSVNEFLARFNATISRFMRRNVYVTLGGGRGGAVLASFNILLVSVLMGLWFGIRLNLVFWGLSLGCFILLEKYLLSKFWQVIAPLFRIIYTLLAVLISFVFFLGDSPAQSFYYLQAMLGLGGATGLNSGILYLLTSNHMTLICGVVLATGIPHSAATLLKQKLPMLYTCLCGMGSILLVTVISAFLL